jgi:ATP-dependent DNA helicase PIF1
MCNSFSTKDEANDLNQERLDRIKLPQIEYDAADSVGYDAKGNPIPSEIARGLLANGTAVSNLCLKVSNLNWNQMLYIHGSTQVGAQVMLLRVRIFMVYTVVFAKTILSIGCKNVVQGVLVNGSIGKVTEFLTIHEANQRGIQLAKIAKDDDDKAKGTQRKHPEKTSLLFAERRQDTTTAKPLEPLNENTFTHTTAWPVVQFTNGMSLLCAPLDFDVEGMKANVEARRLQVSLLFFINYLVAV